MIFDPPLSWQALVEWWHIPERPAQRIWQVLSRDTSTPALTLTYHLHAVDRQSVTAPALERAVVRLMTGPAKPRALLELLEGYVVTGRLTRQDVTDLEEGILRRTNAKGAYK